MSGGPRCSWAASQPARLPAAAAPCRRPQRLHPSLPLPSCRATLNCLLGTALEYVAAQAPLLWRLLDAAALAEPLNTRVETLMVRRVWVQVLACSTN